MCEIILIRPGCTDFDEQHRIQGSLDLPMNERGEHQVRELIDQLRDRGLEAVYTSPSDPARSTAETIGEALAIPVKEADGLRNLDQGLWQGLQIDDIRRKYPKVYKQWKESPESICPPQGETVADAAQRVRKALRKPMKRDVRIGVVASEPLATLLRSVICDREIEGSGPICGNGQAQPIEALQVGRAAPASGNGAEAQGSRDTASAGTTGRGNNPE